MGLIKKVIFLILLSSFAYAENGGSWEYRGQKISTGCLVYPWTSSDNYQEFFETYIGIDDYYGKTVWKEFVSNIGDFFTKEVPIGHEIDPNWFPNEILSLTKYLDNCQNNDYRYLFRTRLDKKFCREFSHVSAHYGTECKDIVLIQHFPQGRIPVFGMTIYAIYEIEGETLILPLRNII